MALVGSVFSIFLLTVALSLSTSAQTFPWNDFKPQKLADVIESTQKAIRPDDSIFLATKPPMARCEVVFTGESRPLPKTRQGFLKLWTGLLGRGDKYADLYQAEYRYTEGGKDYWLPTEQTITRYFERDLKPGDKMVLFLISAGAFRDSGAIDAVLLAEEYQLPKDLDKVLRSQ